MGKRGLIFSRIHLGAVDSYYQGVCNENHVAYLENCTIIAMWVLFAAEMTFLTQISIENEAKNVIDWHKQNYLSIWICQTIFFHRKSSALPVARLTNLFSEHALIQLSTQLTVQAIRQPKATQENMGKMFQMKEFLSNVCQNSKAIFSPLSSFS